MLSLKYKWWIRGLFWAAFMYLYMTILYLLSEGDELTTKHLLIGVPLWGTAGLIFAWVISIFYRQRPGD